LKGSSFSRAILPWARFSASVSPTQSGYGVTEVTRDVEHEHTELHETWRRGGRAGLANPYVLVRIEAVDAQRYASAFEIKVEQVESRRNSGGAPFNAQFADPDGEKQAVLEFGKRHFWRTDGLRRANIMLVFHGCSPAVATSICENGFANIATRDRGFLGNGLYSTLCPEYACAYACGDIDGSAVTPNAAGEYVVIAAWATPGLIYPMSRAVDYERPDDQTSFSRFYQEDPQPAAALQPPFDSHFAAISRSTYQVQDQLRSGAMPDYTELVVREGQQLLPAYRLFFKRPPP